MVRSFLFIFLGIFVTDDLCAQISATLYNKIPPKYQPKDRLHPTDAEVRVVIDQADVYLSSSDTPSMGELDIMAQKLVSKNVPVKEKVKNLSAVRHYKMNFPVMADPSCPWVPYNDAIIALGKRDGALANFVADAYMTNGFCHLLKDECKEAIDDNIMALRYARVAKDTAVLYKIALILADLYDELKLYGKSISYLDSLPHYLTAKQTDPRSEQNLAYYASKADKYLDWYEYEKEGRYRDSAFRYITKLTPDVKSDSFWISQYYFEKARYYVANEDYKQALAAIDSSISSNTAGKLFDRVVLQGVILMKLDREAEGERILKSITANDYLDKRSYTLLSLSLYEYAKKMQRWKEALHYLEELKAVEDEIRLLSETGKIFSITQEYELAQRENEIARLKDISNDKSKQRNLIILVSLFAISMFAFIAYTINKRREAETLMAEKSKKQERQKMEYEMMLRTSRMELEKADTISQQRKNISRDMHDEVASSLVALQYYITSLSPKEMKDDAHPLENIKQEIARIYSHVREYMHMLEKDDKIYVASGLIGFFKRMQDHFKNFDFIQLDIEAEYEKIESCLNMDQQTALRYIFKEALANTLKHAHATQIIISVTFDVEQCHFALSDNGRGFTLSEISQGIGLQSIKRRAKGIGAAVSIDSNNEGTTISGSFSYKKS